MTDKHTKAARSANMAAVKNKNTSIEIAIRSRIFARGFRFTLHSRKLPGSPDIAFPRYKIAAFVHGCFWHGHNCKKGRRPTSNQSFWNQKIETNIARDNAAKSALVKQKWKVVTIWGCNLDKGTTALLLTLKARKKKLTHATLSGLSG